MAQTRESPYDVCILHLADARYYPLFQRQAFSLRDAGYRVALVSWERSKGEGLPGWDGVDVFPITIPAQAFRGKRFFAHYMLALSHLLSRLPARLYQAVDPVTLPSARFAAFRHRTRYNYFSLEYFQGVDQLVRKPVMRRVWRAIESVGLARAHNTAVVCRATAERLAREFHISSPHIVHNVPCASEYRAPPDGALRRRLGIAADTPLAVYKGELAAARGLIPFVKALVAVPEVHFALLGNGILEGELREIAGAVGVLSRVHFAGRVTVDEFPRLLKEADLGHVIHEHVGLNMPYTLPSKLFDYMHAGLPVICGDRGEMAAIVREHDIGWIANPSDPATIEAALRGFVANYHDLEPYRRRARATAQRYCWEIEQVNYLAYVREALESRPLRG